MTEANRCIREWTAEIEEHLKAQDVPRAMSKAYMVPAQLLPQVLAYILFRLIVAMTKAKVQSANNQPG